MGVKSTDESSVSEKLTPPPFSDEQEPTAPLDSDESRSGFGETVENSSARRGGEINARLEAIVWAARYQGVELDPNEFRGAPGEDVVSAAALSTWAQNHGM